MVNVAVASIVSRNLGNVKLTSNFDRQPEQQSYRQSLCELIYSILLSRPRRVLYMVQIDLIVLWHCDVKSVNSAVWDWVYPDQSR
jgi:hypothetical protein